MRDELNTKLEEIRTRRNEVLALLQDTADIHASLDTTKWSNTWPTVGVLFGRFGDHMREHANQIAGTRQTLQANYTDIQRKLAEAERDWGHLLGTLVGLTDDDLDRVPEDGSWTIRETLDHILWAETRYMGHIQAALQELDQA